jgi:hypothetical protein
MRDLIRAAALISQQIMHLLWVDSKIKQMIYGFENKPLEIWGAKG